MSSLSLFGSDISSFPLPRNPQSERIFPTGLEQIEGHAVIIEREKGGGVKKKNFLFPEFLIETSSVPTMMFVCLDSELSHLCGKKQAVHLSRVRLLWFHLRKAPLWFHFICARWLMNCGIKGLHGVFVAHRTVAC